MNNKKSNKAKIAKAIAKVFGITQAEARMAIYKGKEDPGQWSPDADWVLHLEGLCLQWEGSQEAWHKIEEAAGIWIEPYNNAVLCAWND